MVDKTLQELITATQQELYQAAGSSVQVYSESNLAQKIQNAFDMIFTDHWWKRFMTFQTYTLDGTTGRVTGTVTSTFASFEDIYRIYPANTDRPLATMALERNPTLLVGSTPLQYCADSTAGKLIKVLPVTSSGDITVIGRSRAGIPSTFALTDTVPFDSIALIYMAAWQYAVDDAANAGMQQKLQGLFEKRMLQLKNAEQNDPISLNGSRQLSIPTRWGEQ